MLDALSKINLSAECFGFVGIKKVSKTEANGYRKQSPTQQKRSNFRRLLWTPFIRV